MINIYFLIGWGPRKLEPSLVTIFKWLPDEIARSPKINKSTLEFATKGLTVKSGDGVDGGGRKGTSWKAVTSNMIALQF